MLFEPWDVVIREHSTRRAAYTGRLLNLQSNLTGYGLFSLLGSQDMAESNGLQHCTFSPFRLCLCTIRLIVHIFFCLSLLLCLWGRMGIASCNKSEKNCNHCAKGGQVYRKKNLPPLQCTPFKDCNFFFQCGKKNMKIKMLLL